MKRNTFLLTLTTILLASSIFIYAGCDIELKDSAEAAAPLVNQTESGIVLTIKKFADSNTYINIYRRNVTDVDEKNWNKITEYEKIGIVYPRNFSSTASTYTYEDLFVYKDESYQYCVRYSSDNSKKRSSWSDAISPKAKAGKDSNIDFCYDVDELIYDEAKQVINFKSNIRLQDIIKDFEPMIVIKSETDCEIFPLPESIKDKLILKNSEIPLVSVLSSSFLYTDSNPVEIEILGLLGQKKNYDRELLDEDDDISNLKVRSVTWTPLAPVTIKNKNGDEVTKLKVTSPTGQSGYDWTDLE